MCDKDYHRNYYKKNKARIRAYRNKYYRDRYRKFEPTQAERIREWANHMFLIFQKRFEECQRDSTLR